MTTRETRKIIRQFADFYKMYHDGDDEIAEEILDKFLALYKPDINKTEKHKRCNCFCHEPDREIDDTRDDSWEYGEPCNCCKENHKPDIESNEYLRGKIDGEKGTHIGQHSLYACRECADFSLSKTSSKPDISAIKKEEKKSLENFVHYIREHWLNRSTEEFMTDHEENLLNCLLHNYLEDKEVENGI